MSDAQWPRIKELAESSRFIELDHFIASTKDPKERIALYRFAVRSLRNEKWSGQSFDPLIRLADSGIEAALDAGETDQANIICFNMASNLADCWGDDFKRTSEHYRTGLRYAERAIAYRVQLRKGPGPMFMAHWAKGANEMCLGDFDAAEMSFSESLRFANLVAIENGKPVTISKESPYEVLLANGYLAIVSGARGQAPARDLYAQVISACEAMMEVSPDAKEDAEICLAQLKYVHSKLNR